MSRGGRAAPNIEGMYTLKVPFPHFICPLLQSVSPLQVDNISYRTMEDDLGRVFDRYGEIGDIYIPKDFMGGGNKGFGFVRFLHPRPRP